MTETVFFNPGDSLGNFHDYDEAVRSAKIYKQKQQKRENVIVVNGRNNKSFDIFLDENAKDDDKQQNVKAYDVKKKL